MSENYRFYGFSKSLRFVPFGRVYAIGETFGLRLRPTPAHTGTRLGDKMLKCLLKHI